MEPQLAERYAKLKALIASHESAIVAFSGGVDSSLVAYVAGQTLGPRSIAVTSGTPSLKRSDLSLAEYLATEWGITHRVIDTDELQNPDYRANPTNRCFFCKTALYSALAGIAEREGYSIVFNGTNLDDLGDHRPGLQAADEFGVVAPLVEAGFRKRDVRALAAALGLENAEKPQSACLSSRFPYGTAIDRDLLARVEAAEAFLAGLGFTQFRVRHHDDVARLEVLPEELPLAIARREAIDAELRSLGYRFVAVDLGGFRSGALNEGVIPAVQIYDQRSAER